MFTKPNCSDCKRIRQAAGVGAGTGARLWSSSRARRRVRAEQSSGSPNTSARRRQVAALLRRATANAASGTTSAISPTCPQANVLFDRLVQPPGGEVMDAPAEHSVARQTRSRADAVEDGIARNTGSLCPTTSIAFRSRLNHPPGNGAQPDGPGVVYRWEDYWARTR